MNPGAVSNVWNEYPVHDVHMQPIGAGRNDGFDFVGKPGGIGGNYAGSDLGHVVRFSVS